MNSMLTLVDHPAVPALTWTLVHFLWQGTALAFVAYLLSRALRPSATSRYAIGVLTLVAMLVTSIVPFGFLVRWGGDAPISAALSEQTAVDTVIGLVPAVAGLWLAGVALLSMRLLGGWLVARRLAKRALRPVAPEIEAMARRVAGRLALDRVVAVFESAAVSVPVLVGWVRPVVLLPAAAMSGLTVTQVEALLAHELAHVRRHDYLVNLVQSAVETLLFYHPAVWWVSRQVRAEREHCCDDLAVGVCDRVVYATALADLAAMSLVPRTALAATDGSLLARVRRILGGSGDVHTPASGWLPVSVIVLVTSVLVPVALLSAGAGQSGEPQKVVVVPKVRRADQVKVALVPTVQKVEGVKVSVVPDVQKAVQVKVAPRVDVREAVDGQVVVAPKPVVREGEVRVVVAPKVDVRGIGEAQVVVAPKPVVREGEVRVVVAPKVDVRGIGEAQVPRPPPAPPVAPVPPARTAPAAPPAPPASPAPPARIGDQERRLTQEERQRLEQELQKLADALRDNVNIEEIEQRLRELVQRLRDQAGRTEAALRDLRVQEAEIQRALARSRTPELERQAERVAAEVQAVTARLREVQEINAEQMVAEALKLRELREFNAQAMTAEA
jgi:beta-lactamase regulating signal transducer with metallopeptidase domain